MDPNKLAEKNHTIQIRGVGGGDSVGKYSLLSIVIVQGTGDYEESSGSVNFLLITVLVAILALLLILIMSMIKQPELLPSKHMEKSKENFSGYEILEAELLDVFDDFEQLTLLGFANKLTNVLVINEDTYKNNKKRKMKHGSKTKKEYKMQEMNI